MDQIVNGNVNGTIQGDQLMGGFVSCTDCHMPEVAKSANAYDISSHTFAFMSPENSLKYPGLPNSCTVSCHSFLSDEYAAENITYWRTELEAKEATVLVNLQKAEDLVNDMDLSDADYSTMRDKYDEANWSYLNVKEDPSHGAHNFDYEMDLLDHANNLALEIITDLIGGGVISGSVKDADTNAAIPGVTVSTGTFSAVTDSSGNYQMIGVTTGTDLSVSTNDVMFFGYLQYAGTTETQVTVEQAETTTVNFLLSQEALPVTVTPADGAQNVAEDSVITVVFEELVDASTVNITFSDGTSVIPGLLSYVSGTTTTVTYTPDEELSEDKTYSVIMTDSVLGIDGDPIIWKDKIWSFSTKTTEPFKVMVKVSVSDTPTAVEPDETLTGVDKDTTITLIFPVDVNSTTISLKISRDLTLTMSSFNEETMTAVFNIDSPLADNTEYIITLGAGLEDMSGKVLLDSGIAWSFRTKAPPSYELMLGPFMDDEGNPIEGATVIIIVEGVEHFGNTDENGDVTISMMTVPEEGTYSIKITKSGYDDTSYEVTIDDSGVVDQGTIPTLSEIDEKAAEDDDLLVITALIIILVIIILMVALLMRKVPEDFEEEVHEEEVVLGIFECPACGAVVTEDEKVCTECGEEFEEEVFKCPECSAELSPDAGICDECGTDFGPPEDEDLDEDFEDDFDDSPEEAVDEDIIDEEESENAEESAMKIEDEPAEVEPETGDSKENEGPEKED
jgi:hypothetical protein